MAKPTRQPSEPRDTIVFLVKLALAVWLLRSILLAPFVIPSESMMPRLLVGDYLFVTKWNYGWSRWAFPLGWPAFPGDVAQRLPHRGDVVVFRAPTDDHDVIKRVIGLPGDTIQVRHGQVILDGTPVPKVRVADFVLPLTANFGADKCAPAFQSVDGGKPVCRYPQYRETLPGGRSYEVLDQGEFADRDETGEYDVPAGHVFLMGDNRDDSADSRFPSPAGMGYVPVDHLEGRAVVTFFSTDGSASWIKPWTWFTAARPRRIGHGF